MCLGWLCHLRRVLVHLQESIPLVITGLIPIEDLDN